MNDGRALAAWARIEKWLTHRAPEVSQRLLPGADEDELLRFETELGRLLPDDVRAHLARHNGSRGGHRVVGRYGLLGTHNILSARRHWMAHAIAQREPSLFPPTLVPLLQDGEASVIVFSLEDWTMIRIDSDPLGRRQIATSFTGYLEEVARDMERGFFEVTSGGAELHRPSDRVPVPSLDFINEALEV